jgi:hypothetical protein
MPGNCNQTFMGPRQLVAMWPVQKTVAVTCQWTLTCRATGSGEAQRTTLSCASANPLARVKTYEESYRAS